MYLFYYITQVTKQNGSSSLAEKKRKVEFFLCLNWNKDHYTCTFFRIHFHSTCWYWLCLKQQNGLEFFPAFLYGLLGIGMAFAVKEMGGTVLQVNVGLTYFKYWLSFLG